MQYKKDTYTKALEFVVNQKGEFAQERIVNEIFKAFSNSNIQYGKDLVNEAFNQRKMAGYKYQELCTRFYISPEFSEGMMKKYWLGFEEGAHKNEENFPL